MNTAPTPPSPGKPVSAGLFTRLIGWVKSGMIIEGRGYRLHRGPNGTILDIDLAKSAKPAAKIPGCFEIRRPSPAATEGSEEDQGGFDNPYFTVGAHLYQCGDAIDMGFAFNDCIVALCVNTTSASPEASVKRFTDFTELQEYAKDRTVAVHPLYLLGEEGVVLADLRNIPVFPQWEHKED